VARKKHRGGYSSSWIHPVTRLAIYLRDGLGCVYCMRDWSRSDGMTLDHLHPRGMKLSPMAFGVSLNDPTNLVTSCRRYNNLRRHIRASPLFGADEWRNLAIALHVDEDLRLRAFTYARVPLGCTFRDRARSLHRDPPQWLRDMRQLSTTLPGDHRVRAEEMEAPHEMQVLLPSADDTDIPF